VRHVTVLIPEPVLEKIDLLVEEGLYASRSEFVREATRKLLSELLSEWRRPKWWLG